MADLVKKVSQSMPGASIEQVLDEVRRIKLEGVYDELRKKTFESPMDALEYIIFVYEPSQEDAAALLTMLGYDQLGRSKSFGVIYEFLHKNVDREPKCMTCCF
jgi:hypothetical protein